MQTREGEARGRLWHCTMEEYLAERDIWSSSTLGRLIDEGPTAALATMNGELGFPNTKARRIGTYAHEATFENEKFEAFDKTHVVKDWDGRTREGKARKKEVEEAGLTILDPNEKGVGQVLAEREAGKDMRLSILRSAQKRADNGKPWLAKALVAEGMVEQGVRFSCSKTGLPLRCRWDKAIRSVHSILELKTSRHWRCEEFAKEAARLGYHRQAFLECDGYEAVFGVWPRIFHLVVHNEPPYEVALYEMPANVIDLGREEVQAACADVMRRLESSCWELTEELETVTLTYPHWRFAEEGIGA